MVLVVGEKAGFKIVCSFDFWDKEVLLLDCKSCHHAVVLFTESSYYFGVKNLVFFQHLKMGYDEGWMFGEVPFRPYVT